MLRRRENSLALPAGILALLVHGLFFMLMVFSFNWKHVSTQEVAQVELWESIPRPHVKAPELKPEPKLTPPPKPEPKPESLPTPKADIQLKAKPPAPEVKKPPKVEPQKPNPALKAKEEEKKAKEEEMKRKEALRKLQEDLLKDERPVDHDAEKALADAKAATDAKRAAQAQAASSGIVNDYMARIRAKIRSNVNKEVCGNGKPVLVFHIAMMPTGELNGLPQLVQSSGLPACDQAVEFAIMKSVPLPLPPQTELFTYFRDSTLTFKPND